MRFALPSLAAWLACAIGLPGAETPDFPMPVPQEHSATARRLAKPVIATRQLDGMEDLATWTLFGPGQLATTGERAFEGSQSLRLTSPTKLDHPGPTPGRPFAETGARRNFPGEDWSAFNRLSFRVYPHLPGFRNISLFVKFRAEGSDRWSYTFGHYHFVLLQPDQWNHVVWEMPHLPRTNVTALELIYRLQGHEPGATDTVQFDFDDLRLETVAAPDHYRGWDVAPDRLAYCHLGYAPNARKIALAAPSTDTFEVLEGAQGATPAFQAHARFLTNDLGAFAELDFSALQRPGTYRLRYGRTLTPPWVIGEKAWSPAVLATLNQYVCQRCGQAVPGIHDDCHRDWQVAHGDLRIPLNGGWHDAGDLSQGLVNTSEATSALFSAAEHLGFTSQASPASLLADEARWGLAWILRTRFGDGFRATWATMDFWTDGILGNADDVTARAGDSAFDNLVAVLASARGARLLRTLDPIAAAHALRAAEEDWHFALAKGFRGRTELIAAAIRAAVELHRAHHATEYRDQTVDLARQLLQAQQAEPPAGWTVPLAGFFYADSERGRPLVYNHRGHNEGPLLALASLCDEFPDHPDAGAWRQAVRLHADFLRQTAQLNAPWNLPAAGIYSLSATDEASRRQVRQGLRLDDDHYLRRFPVWGDFRGNSGVLLSQARALSTAARVLQDPDLAQLARDVLEWHLGRNPFAQSLMYGVGHDFTPQYTAMSGDITGGLPVGIQTRLDEDIPYWPDSNCFNYAEIWIHPSSRILAVLTDLEAY